MRMGPALDVHCVSSFSLGSQAAHVPLSKFSAPPGLRSCCSLRATFSVFFMGLSTEFHFSLEKRFHSSQRWRFGMR